MTDKDESTHDDHDQQQQQQQIAEQAEGVEAASLSPSPGGPTTVSEQAAIANENGTNNNNNDYNANDDDDDESEFYGVGARGAARRRKMEHWKNSPFAVGVVNPTWEDDRPTWWTCCASKKSPSSSIPAAARDIDKTFPASAIVCSLLKTTRVGNFSVFTQTTEEYQEPILDETTGEVTDQHRTRQRPKLLCVMGPYWTVNLFITFPIILGASGWVCYRRIIGAHIAVIITWSIGTFLLIFSLMMISCRNPGILYRHDHPPPTEGENWRWNDQARTYRPPKARFDPECQAVIEGFDHTCPWTGTAIGSRNMFWFRIFLVMVLVMILYSVVLAMTGGFSFL